MTPSVVIHPAGTVDRRIGYLLMRLAVGFSLLGHGLVRIPKLASFHRHLTSDFTHPILPKTLVSVTGYALPFVEFCIGAMLVVRRSRSFRNRSGRALTGRSIRFSRLTKALAYRGRHPVRC